MPQNATPIIQPPASFSFKSMPSKAMPLDMGVVHFVGIGGIGMSGIAEILHNLGYQVQGSDAAENANVLRLRAMGIGVMVGQVAENVQDVAVVVKSTAVKMDNPEIIAAREKQIPVVRRSEMLAELTRLKATIAVAGSHGKTTTTSLVAQLLNYAGLDPTVINGGVINTLGSNAKLGRSDWLVTEADESDGTFVRIPATVGIVTNMDPEHLDHWGSYDALKKAFYDFIDHLPFYGLAVLCLDDPDVQQLASSITDRRYVTYGLEHENVDFRAVNIRHDVRGSTFDVILSERMAYNGVSDIKDVFVPVAGRHNVANALAAISVGLCLNIDADTIRQGFTGFAGVKRRFTITGEVNGVTIIDDYGHHPVEIAATLAAANELQRDRAADRGEPRGKIIAVVQPHRYSRLASLLSDFSKCFSDADRVLVAPVYAAGEEPIKGVDNSVLAQEICKHGVKAENIDGPEVLAEKIAKLTDTRDMVICLGAGNVTQWAHALPEQLAAIQSQK